jgi:hypothetical protein
VTAQIAILNVGAGDVAVTFNPAIDDEKQRAITMLEDMMRRGYAIMVRLEDGTYARVHEIDETRSSYIIGEHAPAVAPTQETASVAELAEQPRRRGRRGRRSIPIAGSTTTAIARSAGG